MHGHNTLGSNRPALAALAALAIVGAGAGAGEAQEARLGVFGGRAVDEHGAAHAAVTVAPSIAWGAPAAALGLGGQITLFEDGGHLGTARAWARAVPVEAGRLTVVLDGEGSLARSNAGYRAAGIALGPRARVAGASWQVETGPHLAAALGEGARRLAPASLGGELLGAGSSGDPYAETAIERGWTAAGMVDRETFGLGTELRAVELQGNRWAEFTLDGAVAAGRLIVSGHAGERTGPFRERWASGRATGQLGPRAALVLEAGRSPRHPVMARGGGRYAALGIVLTNLPRP